MTIADVQTQVEEIAQAMVMMEATDTAEMARVGGLLQELAADCVEAGLPEAAAIAESAAVVVAGSPVADEVPAEVIAAVNQVLEMLQEMLDQPESFNGFAPCLGAAAGSGGAANAAGDGARPQGLTLSPLVDEAIVSEFLGRQADALGDMEKLILACETNADDGGVESLKRWFHTLKGEAGLLGLGDIAIACHATEDMIQADPPAACVDRLLAVKDWLQSCFDYLTDEGPRPQDVGAIMVVLSTPPASDQAPAAPRCAGVADGDALAAPAAEAAAARPAPVDASERRADPQDLELPDYSSKNVQEGDVGLLQDFIAEAVEHLDASEAHLLTIEADPHASEALNAVFRAFHTIKGLAGFAELDHIQELAHRAENLLDMARKGEIELRGLPADLVFESVDMMKRLIEGVVVALAGSGYPQQVPQLPNLLARLQAATSGVGPAADSPAPAVGKSGFVPLANLPRRQPPDRAGATRGEDSPAVAPPQESFDIEAEAAGAERDARGGGKSATGVKVKEAMRVDAERLDRLIETIGEMVIAESMVSQSPEIRANMSVKLARDLDHLDKISRELQEIGMSLRMVPVRPVFQKMARLVRDLAKKTNRKVEFVMAGEDTELDKNVVDKIGDPLVHMVRNAVDHGLEPTAAERRAAGKPEAGRIELRAFHKGGNICIEIQDDGRGLPREKILAKAIARGLIREGDALSDRDIHNLIFEPGFSTAEKVTDISGRGVGMDVVRRNIEELRGTCEIHSEPGKGSTFSIKLPLTLAIIEGMVISCGPEHYIVPTLSVVRLVRPAAGDISLVFDRGEMLAFEDEHLPLYRLGRLFNVAAAKIDPTAAVVVVVEEEGRKIGLLADDLLGQQSIVIKSLGEAMQNTEGVAGGAIMSNGNVALILDVAGLIRAAHNQHAALSLPAAPAAMKAGAQAPAAPALRGSEAVRQPGG